MNKADGGPVHPTTFEHYESSWTSPGMALRDYFATHATEADIAEFLEKGRFEEYIRDEPNGRKTITHRLALRSRQEAKFRYADAMIEARKK